MTAAFQPARAGIIAFPAVNDEHAYALEISGQSMKPAYREGDIIVVSPAAPVRRGDRVVVRTRDGEVMAKELKRKTAKSVELKSLNLQHADRTLPIADVLWIARIVCRRGGTRRHARRVQVLDAQQPATAVRAGVQVAGQARHQRTRMQRTGG